MAVNQAADPRDALVHLFGQQWSILLGIPTTATRLVNAPEFSGKSCLVGLFSFPDGTPAAIAQMDLPLASRIGHLLSGEKIPNICDIEAAGHMPIGMQDALNEFFNVLAGVINSAWDRRVKFTGVALLPLPQDFSEIGGIHLPFQIQFPKVAGGRLDFCGRAIAELTTAAKAQSDESNSDGLDKLAQVFSNILNAFCGRKVTITTGGLLVLRPDFIGSLATFAPHGSGLTSMLIITEIPLSAYLGAAPMMIPKGGIRDQIVKGRFDGMLNDGLHEVYNILAAPFANRKIKLEDMLWLPGTLPEPVRKLMPPNARVPALTIDIDGYGSGVMALLGDRAL